MNLEPEDEQLEVLRIQVQDLSVQIDTVIGGFNGLTTTQLEMRRRQLELVLSRLQPAIQAGGNLSPPPTVTPPTSF